jgi:hypothetical protein
MVNDKTKFDENNEFFWNNYYKLKYKYSGHWVSILNNEVVYVAPRGGDIEFQMWSSLDTVEQLEVYTTYIKGRNEIFVV